MPEKLLYRLKHPIKTTLLKWFILLSILPLIIVSVQSYYMTVSELKEKAAEELIHDTELQVKFLNNWFDDRKMDIEVLSDNQNTLKFMHELSKEYKKSNLPPNEFVKSYNYLEFSEAFAQDFIKLSRQYIHIYDLFLIDPKGNLLYTVAKESDLGTNLNYGPYAKTKFADTFRKTLNDGKTYYSDLERYGPSNDGLYGFLTTPIVNEEGNLIGVIAMQVKPDKIFQLFQYEQKLEGISHYMISDDGTLRSSIDNSNEILIRKIKTEQVKRFQEEHHTDHEVEHDEEVIYYTGPAGNPVYGLHQRIEIMDVKYGVISEINEDILLAAARNLALQNIFILLLLSISVVLIAFSVARRFTKPIQTLADAANKISENNIKEPVWVDSDNEVVVLADAYNDMIEEIQANEQALKEHSAEIQNTLHELKEQKLALDAHAIVGITDLEGNITYINEKFIQISGYSREELLGSNHRMVNSGEHSKEFWTNMYETVSSGKKWNSQVKNRAKDGRIYWVETTIIPFSNEMGEIQSYVAIRTDITEQKKTEALVNESLALNSAILESTDNGILASDLNGNTLLHNQRFIEMWNIPDKLLHSQDAMMEYAIEQLEDPDAFKKSVLDVRHDAKLNLDDTVKLKDGRVFSRHSHPIYISSKHQGRIWNFRDITEAENFNQKLLKAKVGAEQVALAKSEFLASMSHEIRTPMNGVLGMLSLLNNSELTKTQRHQANIARSSAESLLTLINDILDFSKVEAGKLELDPVEFHLRNELGDLSEAIAFRAQEKDVELIFDVKDIERTLVVADSGRLRQILTNLIGNAIKFTTDGEVLVTASLTAIDDTHGELKFSIKDSGIGIPKDKIATLFDSFTQVDTSTTRKYGGSGLGLSIAKQLCELMGGKLTVESVEGVGSTFSFNVNVGLSTYTSLVMPSVVVADKSVLIIDDNEVNRMVVREQLIHWGMQTFEADSAKEALVLCQEYYNKHHEIFDIAIVDMHMPDMDGAELGKILRTHSHYDSMKMVMMTSLGSRGDAQTFADIGFDAFFPKPTTTNDLFHALNVLIDNDEALASSQPILTKEKLHVINDIPSDSTWPESTRILLVEDNLTNQLVANGILETFNLQAEIANHGQEALDMLNASLRDEKPYTLILMDCQMPILDGWKTSEAIREGKGSVLYKDIPIVAMTANAMKGDKEICFASGMSDYLAKPISGKSVEVMLNKWLLDQQ
jgi:two-component system, sensor histidine kinase and response regulator